MPDGSPWPRIGIVTPSYNQGRFIEETIRSVLLQGYPNLDYVIMDGGSGDETREIIGKYEPWLRFWKSGPDQGQTHAINEGWRMLETDILAWLNSDDVYLEGALRKAALGLRKYPGAAFVYGDAIYTDDRGEKNLLRTGRDFHPRTLLVTADTNYIPQPAVFIRGEAARAAGPLDESFEFAMDWEYWLRLGLRSEARYLKNETFARVREHQGSKTSRIGYRSQEEYLRILEKYSGYFTRGEELREYKKVLSRTHYTVGHHLCLRGEVGKGRGQLLKSLRVRPLSLKPLPALLLSAAGPAGYRNLVELYRRLRYDR